MKKIAILGSTGSIGVQAVEVILNNSDKFQVVALSANGQADLVLEQAQKLNCKTVLIADKEKAKAAKNNSLGIKIYSGIEQVEHLLDHDADIVLNALVGAVGLEATLLTLQKNTTLALANKESLVAGGDIINKHYADKKDLIIPVDSEHSAIFQLLLGEKHEEINNLIITASGGPFREKSLIETEEATVEQALAHPRWNMGAKITIDSATLVNKGLEVMEAHYLFDMPYEKIKVVIHPQSIIHSMLEFADGSVKAHLGPTDMRIPIQYALSHPQRLKAPAGFSDFVKIGQLTFEEVDNKKFRALKLAYEAGAQKQGYPVVFSAANEVAVAAFLQKRIGFGRITDVIEAVMNDYTAQDASTLGTVKNIDSWARNKASAIERHYGIT